LIFIFFFHYSVTFSLFQLLITENLLK